MGILIHTYLTTLIVFSLTVLLVKVISTYTPCMGHTPYSGYVYMRCYTDGGVGVLTMQTQIKWKNPANRIIQIKVSKLITL